MKNSKILLFGILLVGMHLTSCKKDADQPPIQNGTNQQIQPDNQAQNKVNLFEKSITVYSADKTNSTTLRFRAASKDLLDKMPLDNIEFTLVKNPESPKNAAGVDAPAISDNAGYSGYSGNDASLLQGTNEKQVLPKDGIEIDLPNLTQTESVSLQVKSKNFNKGPSTAATYYYNFYYRSWGHKIQVNNYYSTPLSVYFDYWYYPYWYYSGYHYTLYNGGWAWYRNCSNIVGAEVYHQSSYSYVVYYWSSCTGS
jgi:hypothetical protein